jgi:hypothetical protein
MNKSFWAGFGVAVLICFSILGVIFVSEFRTAKVVTETTRPQKVGELYEADLYITIEEGDSILADSKVLVMIEKEGVVVETEIITFGQYVLLSDNPIKPLKSGEVYYYQHVGTYTVKLSDIIQYSFKEVGDYEVQLLILDRDVII